MLVDAATPAREAPEVAGNIIQRCGEERERHGQAGGAAKPEPPSAMGSSIGWLGPRVALHVSPSNGGTWPVQ